MTKRNVLSFLGLVVAAGVVLTATAANGPSEEQLYATGKARHREKSYRPATQAFEELLKRFPKSTRGREVQFLLADSFHRARRLGNQYVWPKAEEAYRKLADSEVEDLWRARAQAGLARLYERHYSAGRATRLGLFEKAVATYEKKVTKASSRTLRRELAEAYVAYLQAGTYQYGYDPNWEENLKRLKEQIEKQAGDAAKPAGKPAPAPPIAVPFRGKALRRRMPAPPMPPRPTPRPTLDEHTKKRFAWYAEVGKILAKLDALEPGRDLMAKARWTIGQRVGDAEKLLEDVVENFADTEWWDDAVYRLGSRRESQQKYLEALALYQKLIDRLGPNRSRYIRDAQRRMTNIRKPVIGVSSQYACLPGTKPTIRYNWRNQANATFRLSRTEPLGHPHHQSLIEMARAGRGAAVKTWTVDLENQGKHLSRSAEQELDLADQGVYLLAVEAGPAKADTLVLITRLAAVTKSGKDKSIIYVADALTGEPIPAADLQIGWSYYANRRRVWQDAKGTTNDAGLFTHDLPADQRHRQFYILARKDNAYAFVSSYRSYWTPMRPGLWFYGYTDRPAYRPDEDVNFKFIVRHYDGNRFQNTAGRKYRVRINDARGTKLYEKILTTNENGTLDGSLKLAKEPTLGQYTIHLRQPDNRGNSGYARFRVEEYKLPEYKVDISTGKPTYRVGDQVELKVAASYYFGGPVPEADCELIVRQKRYWHFYRPYRPYSWYYDDIYHRRWGRWGWSPWYDRRPGSIVKRATVKTDEHGVATLTFDTPKLPEDPKQQYDYQYSVEARVVDKSRREIKTSTSLKITVKPFYVHVTPKAHVYLPGDRVEIDVLARNANSVPVQTEGMFTIYRATYNEEKTDYDLEKLEAKRLATGAEGKAFYAYSPDKPGYLKLEMTALTDKEEKVIGTGWVWVASKDDHHLGYRLSGVQVVPNKETYNKGETAQVLLVSHFPNTHVWLGVEGDRVYQHQLVPVRNRSKLVTIPIKDEYSPNVFITANAVRDAMLWRHQKEVVVPPEDRFIDVKITTAKKTYLPGEDAQFTLLATDAKGQPVDAELSLGLVDSSVYYIQPEYAPDIRKHFYGRKRRLAIRTNSSFNWIRYKRATTPEEKAKEQVRQNLLRGQGGGGANGAGMDRAAFAGRRMRKAAAPGAPMAEAAMAAPQAKGKALASADKRDAGYGGVGQPLAQPEIREDFRATAFWQPAIHTGPDGKAVVSVQFPDSLTDWTATARAVTPDTRVGNVTFNTQTKKNIIVRLQCPRFFQEKDELLVSAIVHNYLDVEKDVKVTLKQSGLSLDGAPVANVTVPSGGETRVDWKVKVVIPGEAKVMAMAQTDVESDAMSKVYDVLPHGVEKFVAKSGTVGEPVVALGADPAKSPDLKVVATETITLPEQRNKLSTVLNVDLSPSIASTMLDSLEYLAKYPYGCTEQTMSRFLPSVVVAKTLRDLGVRNEKLEAKLPDMIKKGLNRLYSFQRGDGGWGWWRGGRGDAWMTSYVVYGLTIAGQADVAVDQSRLQRGISYLKNNLVHLESRRDTMAYALHVLAHHKITDKKWLDKVWQNRDDLNSYSRALMAVTFKKLGDTERARIMLRNLEDRCEEDKDNKTAHWGKTSGYYRWSYDAVEATSYALKAYLAVEPNNRLVKPLMKWLVYNRRGNRWKSTRDTAMAVYGLADYVRATKELAPDYKVTVLVNDKPVRTLVINKANALTIDGRITLGDADLQSGKNVIRIVKEGSGNLYYTTGAYFYTKEDKIKGAGHELFVKRTYTKVALDKDNKEVRTPLPYGAKLDSGDRIEVRLELEAKNDYEYLVFEDPKPSGCETVQIRSGYQHFRDPEAAAKRKLLGPGYYGGLSAYMEVRDEKTAFFVSRLKQGFHTITYKLRAEIPGVFNALPTSGYAMYIPEIRGLSDELRLHIGERKEQAAAPATTAVAAK